MNLKGISVKHKIFGEGIIKQNDERYLVIEFLQGDKKFLYPDVFEKYISINDSKVAKFINLEIEKNKCNKNIIKEKSFSTKESLLKIKNEQIDKINQIIKQRKIEYLVHFTRIDNLNSILKNGLIPVGMQQNMKISSVHNDEQRMDSQLDCTSCSIEFPNYKLFYTFREHKFPGNSWVVVVLDKNILFSSSIIAYFCQTNAAGVFPWVSSAKELCTAVAFEKMFYESFITKDNKLLQRASLRIRDCMATDPQAEVLISDVIDKKYIRCICFQRQLDIDEYISTFGKDLLNEYDYQVFPSFFNARKDYMFWKKES